VPTALIETNALPLHQTANPANMALSVASLSGLVNLTFDL